MNKFILMGRLTKNPETKTLNDNDTKVATFTLAVNRKYVAPGQERQADFFNLVAYGKMAEFCAKYYEKGQQVLVEGRMQNRTWDDESGQKRYSTDYIVEQGYFAESKKSKENNDGFINVADNEELPF